MNLEERSFLRVSKNALARFLAQVLARLLSLALVALVARYESAEALGSYVLVLTLVGFAGAASDLGLNIFLTRETARQIDLQRQRELLGTVLPLKLGLSVVVLAGLLLLAAVAAFPKATVELLPVGGLLLLPEAVTGTVRAFVNGRQRMEVSGLIDVTMRFLAVAASFPALLAGFGVTSVLLCTLGATLVGVVLYSAVLWRWRATPEWHWAPAAWGACLAESYPFALTSLAAMVYSRLDLVLLGLWQDELAVGWYGAAYKLWEAIGLLPASLLEAMFPEMSRLASTEEGRRRLRDLFRTASWAMLGGGLLLAVAGLLAAGALVPLVYGGTGSYTPAVLPFRLLICAVPAMFLYLLSGHVLYALGRQRRVTIAMLVVGLVNVVLNLIVIPRWSYLGAAAVALFSEWLLVTLVYPQARSALGRG
ncbi:MAG: oligosaccharide flippase family protein [Anaerolineae bacterium]|jgi:O-antigen/teichoic acid export membrane protein